MPAIYLHQTNANPTLMLLTYSNPRVYSLLCITPLHVNTLKTFWKCHKSCPYVSVMECVWNFTSPQMLVFHLGHFPPLQDFSLRGRGKCRQFSSAVGWPERLTQVTLRRLKPFPQEAGHYDEKEREREKESHAGKQLVMFIEWPVRIVLLDGIMLNQETKWGCDLVEQFWWFEKSSHIITYQMTHLLMMLNVKQVFYKSWRYFQRIKLKEKKKRM